MHAVVAREERDVCLVLHLLTARREQGGWGVAVRDVAPRAREELRVGLVPAQRRDADRLPAGLRGEPRASDGLLGRGADAGCRDAEPRQRRLDDRDGRPSLGRAERVVDRCRDAPTEDDRAQEIGRVAASEVHRREREHRDETLAEPARRAGQVRRRHDDHRHEHPQAHQREARRAPEVERHLQRLPEVRVEYEERDDPAEEPCARPRDEQIAGESPAPCEQDGHRQQREGPERDQVVQQPEERRRAVRKRMEEVHDLLLGGPGIARVEAESDDDERGDDDAHDVTRPPARGAGGRAAYDPAAESLEPTRGHGPSLSRRGAGSVAGHRAPVSAVVARG